MKIAIAGFGAEGRSSLAYYRHKFPEAEIIIFDQRDQLDKTPKNLKTVLGVDALKHIPNDFLVIRSAGLAPFKIAAGSKIWSATNEFFQECPAPIIGVTGTKGKGTTASFIHQILEAAFKSDVLTSRRHSYLVGNIGQPALEILPQIKADDVVVYELSSFQLWDIERSPQVAVMTMLEPDHLDVHVDMNEYSMAKGRIFRFQTADDLAVYNDQDDQVQQLARLSAGHKRPFPNKKFVHVKQGWFVYDEQPICPLTAVKLPGQHNQKNAMAAINAVWTMIGGDVKSIAKGLAGFSGLPHRLKLVRQVDGVQYYDDSIATTPGSAIAALAAFDQPKILILGGHDKGADYRPLGEAIENSAVRAVFAIGANRAKIARQVSEKTTAPIHLLDSQNLNQIVKIVSQSALSGDVVIMSPAAASFDMFRNYQDRGQQFVAAVEKL
jgi:UDP-N-acetylmuramoylalanine--D-glutamate ligase